MKYVANIIKNFTKVWYTILLVALTVYNIKTFVGSGTILPLTKNGVLFIFNIILMCFPLFSEIELGGIKIRKEMENIRNDINEKFSILSTSLSYHNSSHINIALPSQNEIKNILLETEKQKTITKSINENINNENKYTKENNVVAFLAIVRKDIEVSLKEIIERNNIFCRQFMTSSYMLKMLIQKEIINPNLGRMIQQIIMICNRGIHGEIVDENYIRYVENIYKYVLNELENLKHK